MVSGKKIRRLAPRARASGRMVIRELFRIDPRLSALMADADKKRMTFGQHLPRLQDASDHLGLIAARNYCNHKLAWTL